MPILERSYDLRIKGFTIRRTLLRKNLVIVQQGFTIIELLVAVVTMTLLFAVGFANYRGFQDRQGLISASRSFKADLRFAQERALSGTKPTGCGTLNGYKLIYLGVQSYQIAANCDNNSDISVKTVDFSDTNPTIQFNSPFSFVFFNVLGRGVRTSLTVNLRDNKTPPNLIPVSITRGGEIN